VVLVGAESRLPYQRPPLSKGYLIGRQELDRLRFRPPEQYQRLAIDVRTGEQVEEVEPEAHRVRLGSGETLAYSRLLLATGGRPRRLPGHEGALYLRTLDDCDRLRQALDESDSLSIIGAGFVGAEVAAAARTLEREVSVYEALQQPLERVLGLELGAWLAGVHRAHGVDLHLGVRDLPELGRPLLVAVGSEPVTELAAAAGLEVEQGVIVDELGRTSAPDIYSCGDAARFWSPLFEARIRVEHFQTARKHGAAVGAAMAGAGWPFAEAPWFWSDQYEVNLQYVGGGLDWTETAVRGTFGQPPFTVFYLKAGRLRGAAGINDGRTIGQVKAVMEARVDLSRAQLEDPAFDLKAAARPATPTPSPPAQP
jgi:3-phenylpropionate/trans-cinnamate dioxygenase ferredoxin reductase subunit